MRETKSRKGIKQKSAITLRRSPRFLHNDDPKTPEPQQKKMGMVHLFFTPPLSSLGESHTNCNEISAGSEKERYVSNIPLNPRKGCGKSARNDMGFQKQYVIEKRVTRSSVRQSKRVNNLVDVCVLEKDSSERGSILSRNGNDRVSVNLHKQRVGNIEKRVTSRSEFVADKDSSKRISILSKKGKDKAVVNSHKQYLGSFEKRVTRSSIRTNTNQQVMNGKKVAQKGVMTREGKLEMEGQNKVSVNLHKQFVGNIEKMVTRDLPKKYVIEKRVTRSSLRPRKCLNNQVVESEKDSNKRVSILSKEGKVKIGVNSHKQSIGNIDKKITRRSSQAITSRQAVNKKDENESGFERGSGDENCKRKASIGVKRKRDHADKKSETVRGWTEKQETTLRRAYFTAKPTPHFWNKVARMVPGKSAGECFNRIHSDHLTPPQPHTRSRARTQKSPPLSLSTSKLLSPANTKIKRLRSTKRNYLLAQKTVRQLLQKQHKEDKDYEPDLFSVLEPNTNPSPLNFQMGTPISSPIGTSSLRRCIEMSSSSHKNRMSRFSSIKPGFISPPVLKQVKNKALHEKFIDQLHYRDAKRKAELKRNGKCHQGKNDKRVSNFQMESIKVAKDSLMFEAQDAINQFRSLQSSVLDDNSDIDDDKIQSNEDEGEDEL